MSDVSALPMVMPAIEAIQDFGDVNSVAIGGLTVTLLTILLDGLKRVGPITKAPWLIDAAKLFLPAIGRWVTAKLSSGKKGGK